jgi:DNA-binding IclR family transcriptional regulator
VVPALDKGLDVLELLAREAGGLSLNEIARSLGRTSSELFRMVVTLARRGYIEQRDGDRYTLTLKLFELAHRHKPIKVADRGRGASDAGARASGAPVMPSDGFPRGPRDDRRRGR